MGAYTDYTLARPSSVAELLQQISDRSKIPARQLVLLHRGVEMQPTTLISEATTLTVLIDIKRI
jgi:hypothetical protein